MNNKEVGVVIIGRNEGERLILCLESILKLQVPCIYVDSQSKDNSVAEAERRGVNTVVLDTSAPINASRARNTGFKALMAGNPDLEFVHFIDADCELYPNWLEHAVNKLNSSKEIAIVCGRLHEKYKYKNAYTRLCDIDWYIKPGEIEACGGIFTMRRAVFNEAQGFDERLIAGADPELCLRVRQAKHKIYCLSVDMGTHDSNMQYFSQYWKRSVKTGYAYISKMNLGGAKKQVISALVWSIFIPLTITFLSFFINVKFILLFLIYPLQVLKIYLQSKEWPFPIYSRCLYSIFCVIGKFAESVGILKYIINSAAKLEQNVIEYKVK